MVLGEILEHGCDGGCDCCSPLFTPIKEGDALLACCQVVCECPAQCRALPLLHQLQVEMRVALELSSVACVKLKHGVEKRVAALILEVVVVVYVQPGV